MSEIDVSKCQYYSKVDNCCHIFGNPLTATPCGYHKGCYYKQRQQLKKENKELNYELDRNIDEAQHIIKNLEQKLEKIKVIAQDIIENDCYENSDAKAEKILEIIEGEEE